MREFEQREGDPNTGGTRGQIVTVYRQNAVKCASYLAEHGPSKGAVVARETGIDKATRMMADNHHGWFVRVSPRVYDLTEEGREVLTEGRKVG